MKRLPVFLLPFLFLISTAVAQDDLALLKFVVLRDFNGKPIRNASVVLHPVNGKGKQERGGLQLKADAEGKASFDGVPYGKLRVQVLAPGFQTFGEDYDINAPTKEITIRLKRPTDQYSIYSDKNNDTKDDSAAPKKDAPPPDKPSGDKPK